MNGISTQFPRFAAAAIVILVVALAAPGCARRQRNGVARMASSSMNCPIEQLVETPMGAGMWRVSGCGLTATYRCGRRARCVATAPPTPTTGGGQMYAQPGYVQPGYVQPGYVQPGYVQPAYSQPAYGQPVYR